MRAANNMGDNDRAYRGRHRYTTMEAFDRLPKAVREAMRNADHNWAADQLYHVHKSKKHPHHARVRTTAAMVAFLKSQDKDKHEHDAERGLVCGGQR